MTQGEENPKVNPAHCPTRFVVTCVFMGCMVLVYTTIQTQLDFVREHNVYRFEL